MEFRPLQGKVALVTGAARRIGRAIAVELARAGADIAFTFRRSTNEAFATEQAIVRTGAKAMGVRLDLSHSSHVKDALATVLGTFHRLDILVNNAGRYETVAFDHIDDAGWNEMLAINLSAPFLLSREALPHLRASGDGRIIHLSSVGAIRAFPTHVHYCASKAGLTHLTRAMARALAPAVTVNAVAPGLIVFEPELSAWEQSMQQRTPLQRAGTAEDVARAVRYLATCSRFITGQMLVVDGGLSLV